MRQIDSATDAALASGHIVPRDFLWIEARNRATGAPVERGFWSDLGTVQAPVLDPVTGQTTTRSYAGAGGLISVGPVALVTGFSVQTVDIQLSQIEAGAVDILRTYDLRRARVQLHRGYMDPASFLLVAPALPFFFGEVDQAPLTTPAEGQDGSITITATSHAQELTRSNPAKRSDADQRQRDAGDGFFRHAATVGSWRIFWGQKKK